MASLQFLNPNNVYQAQVPSGNSGLHAGFLLPFYNYNYWYADGLQQSFTNSEIIQKPQSGIFGKTRPDTFQKDCCGCGESFPVV